MSHLLSNTPNAPPAKKAKQWLEDHGFPTPPAIIVEENPTEQELSQWIARSGLPIKRVFQHQRPQI